MLQHVLPIRVYYADTDASGLVHHSNYFKYFERARTEALRSHGFELSSLYQEFQLQFVVHSAEIAFLQGAYLDQLLYIQTNIIEVRQASIMYQQEIHLDPKHQTIDPVKGSLICRAKLKIACVNAQFKPSPMPLILRTEIEK